MGEWYEDYLNSFWISRKHGRKQEAQFVWDALDLRSGERVLDAPCGDGAVAVHLANRGARVTGVDRMRSFIARARRRFQRAGLGGRFRVLDLRRLDYEKAFDAVLNWFGSFGYFSEDENLRVLRTMSRALDVGGRILVDQPNRERVLRHFRGEDKAGEYKTFSRWDESTQRIETTYTAPPGAEPRQFHLSMRLYTPAEMRKLFEQADLEVTGEFGDFLGEDYTRGSRRLIVVGRKTTHRREKVRREATAEDVEPVPLRDE
ncbi:MAG: SAM-dependent methyltransferase [Phycisphaerae bacterium]